MLLHFNQQKLLLEVTEMIEPLKSNT
jgi:hypothetical protein